ncbi:patatin-like phospholipase family protein [Anaplasma capra]|uniref:patatin-like phospholipase family protein n=1 Tax=Anaplasma capra TaxID=1562740 RepID=UPI0021D56D78|nr:patatin-like phospholipase family protein [Anaplasma capra]MCU7611345.1 patatin-like phospholipase family protein [Anaplasma capra]MCU7612419.1 patatin-like phospholipase family protein [Anaplasma capra]
MTKYVLSIDGGGIRGIIAARVLCEIEKRLGGPVCDIFDLFVGSSVGSIIAVALAIKDSAGRAQYTASDLLGFFLKFGPQIFSFSLVRQVLSIAVGARFSPANLEKTLRSFFADLKMGDVAASIMVPSYDLCTGHTLMMRNWEPKFQDLKLVDILLAASAAPTIFPPRKIVIQDKEYSMVDSGLVANNPSVCGYAASCVLYPGEEVHFLSVGSGERSNPIARVRDNLTFWAFNAANVFLDAGMDAVDYQMSRMGNVRCTRITGFLNRAKHDFTDASNKNMLALRMDADEIIAKNSERIDSFMRSVRK